MATIERRTNSDGTVTFRVKVRLKGYPTQTASFSRITDAKRWAGQTEADIRAGRHFTSIEAKKHTLADLIDRYIKHEIPKKGSQARNQTTQLLWWRDALGAHLLSAVTPAMIAEQRDLLSIGKTVRGQNRSPGTVNRYLAALSHAFAVATREWGWVDENPLRKVARPTEPPGRDRYLDDDERKRLLDACRQSSQPWLYPCVVLALSTGMRQAEILNLHWRRPDDPPKTGAWGVVHLDRARIVLHRTKNKSSRAVPLAAPAREGLCRLVRRLDTTMLFPSGVPGKPLDPHHAFVAAVAHAQIEDFRFHDLRHSAASYLAMSGASLADIAEILGQKTLAIARRYTHLSDSHVSGVLERMNKKVLG